MFPNTQDKLNEANYCLNQMIAGGDQDIFRYKTSAFVSAAEAVIAFLLQESNAGQKFNSWRAHQISAINDDPFKRIIKEQRDQTNHRKPIQVDTDVTVYVEALTIRLEVIPVTVSVGADDLISSPVSVSNAIPITTVPPAKAFGSTTRSKSTHYFKGHRENDVVSICKSHLENLIRLVADCEREFGKLNL